MPASPIPDTALVEIEDAHFAWLLGEGPAPSPMLRLPPGGMDTAETLGIVRRMTRRLYRSGSRGSWLVVSGGEAVGLASYKQKPDAHGVVEIGYGIAASRRGLGHATRAVAALLGHARADPAVGAVRAETAAANVASQRALERNGFAPYGTGDDPDDGPMILWRLALKAVAQA
ncbi:MAG TPA: GNAT family N-acetyltransferase [Rhizomicrobium sp.]|jgi:RimJ/RimL family protein N-acetyltransferase|nr:GNAT family N-acetyltransferase [Rhizomicrobium sp.]